MTWIVDLLAENHILLLIVVAALGYLIGEIKIKGSGLGVSAVLFAGLGIGALDPRLELPEEFRTFGLVLFVYTIALASGPGFFASFRRKGLRDNLLIVGMLVFAALLTFAMHALFSLNSRLSAGLFAGSLTNTPTLASILEALKQSTLAGTEGDVTALLAEPVIGYSIAYPIGIIGMIVAIAVMQRLFKIDYQAEALSLKSLGATNRKLSSSTILVTRAEGTQKPIGELVQEHGWEVLFGRMRRPGSDLTLAQQDTVFQEGDLVSVIGAPEDIDAVTAILGEVSDEQLMLDRREYDFRRIFVSSNRVAGQPLRNLNMMQQFGAIISRIRRGDIELLPTGDTVLELGDRVRVVARPEFMPAISKFFGDSYKALSEINLLTFSLGIMAGLLLGMIKIPMPGGITFSLGFAGGPLIVGLILGKFGRTGPLVWQLPFTANHLLRQLGLVLFFATVGIGAGEAFFSRLGDPMGLKLLLGGAVITCATAFTTLFVGYKVLGIPMSLLSGMLSGLQTQPAVLSYSLEQSKNDLPNIGYATVYPVATITKIILAQLLLNFLV